MKLLVRDYEKTADTILKQEFNKKSDTKVTERISLIAACSNVPITVLCFRYLQLFDFDENVQNMLDLNLKFYDVELI